MIAHDGVGVNRDSKALAQQVQPLANPVLPVLEIAPCQFVVSA